MNQPGWIRVAVDQVVSRRPCNLYAITITSDGGGEADAVIYDGVSTKDPTIINVYTVDEAMATISFAYPLKTQRGLYVDIGTNVKEVLIQYLGEAE